MRPLPGGAAQPAAAPGLGQDTETAMAQLLRLSAGEAHAARARRDVWWPGRGLVFERPSVV